MHSATVTVEWPATRRSVETNCDNTYPDILTKNNENQPVETTKF